MRVVIQRVSKACVKVNEEIVGEIAKGLLVFIGIEDADTNEDITWLSNKIVQMRLFNDENGIMNKSLVDVDGRLLLVSQFTLHASTKKGNRPSYIKAAKADFAVPLYERMIVQLSEDAGEKIETGVFGADMQVELVNDGPVTIVLDSKNKE